MSTLLDFLPAVEGLKELRLVDRELLVMVAGFEERRLAAAKALTDTKGGKVAILRYKPDHASNDFDALARELGSKGVQLKESNIIEYDRFQPRDFPEAFKRCIKVNRSKHVILDISAMSKLAILLCLDVCRELNVAVSIHYAEAKRYGPSQADYEKAKAAQRIHRPSIQIYTGVQGVLRVARFSSVAMQGQPTAAIAFTSFNEELIQALLNCVYPARLFLINSKPPKLKWREEATAWIHEQLLKEWPARDNPVERDLPVRTASTLDYRESVRILQELYWQLTIDHRVLLGPTGSKMQTVGCYLAVALHPDIHVEYPTPEGFLNLYSEGIGAQWLVDFGALGDFVAELSEIERAEHLDVRLPGKIFSS